MWLKIASEYDQEIPQSQTADNPMAPVVQQFKSLCKLIVCEVQTGRRKL